MRRSDRAVRLSPLNTVTSTGCRSGGPFRRLRRWRALFPGLVLAAALIAAQAVAVGHDLGPDGHPAGEICAVCVSFGTLGTGAEATPQATLVDAVHEPAAASGTALRGAAPKPSYHARAPPIAS